MPCHHTLKGYLAEYIERARSGEAAKAPLFQAIKHRPNGRGQAELPGNGQIASTAGRWCGGGPEPRASPSAATGFTAYLENGGTLEKSPPALRLARGSRHAR
jgi:hypothetical protein